MTTFPLNQVYQRNLFLPFLRSFLDDFSQDVELLYLDGKTQFANKVYRLGRDNSLDLEVYEIHHTSSNDARVGIAKDAFRILHTQSFSNRALVVFIPEGSKQWRLSLLQIEAEINEKGRLEKGYSNPRRHSYLLGEGGSLITPQKNLFELGHIAPRREGTKQLTAIEDLQSRFSVEALTKEFYNKLYNWYLWAVEPSTGVTFPNLVSNDSDDRDEIAIKIIRLITRLLFVWFIKQKGLVPSALFDEEELDKILANFDSQSVDDGKYYNAILQNLFFATLNNEVTKRRFMSDAFQGKSGSYGVKTLFRDSNKSSWFKISHDEVLHLFHNVPFMNCGLFECLDRYEKSDIDQEKDIFLDGFSSRDSKLGGHFKYRAFLPNKLFFAPEHCETVTVEENKKQKRVPITVMGLIPLLKLYNFTVQENTPSDMEVSLDPELLGQVFENLLAAYNPETKESARESTGSFYTPRPIVEYMVNESLIAYLQTKVPSVTEDTWRALISYNDIEFSLTEDERLLTLNALYECKILDPACGSGAFPMGMLQQMVHITRKLESEFDPYKTKLRIINNCIYGSDIQPIAMLISKLRFFISLICEQDDKSINFDDAANNFGINTLPNLETKFVAANSLLTADIHKYADDNWTLDPTLIKLKNELLEIRRQHFSVRTQSSKLKKREEDRLKREEIYKYIINSTSQPDPIKIQMYESRIKHLSAERALYEGEKIVEEYVSTQAELFAETEMQLVRKDVNKLHRDRIDAEIADLHKAIEKENNKRNPVGFNAAIKQIADWNPYNQLKFAPFFDPDWMFGIKDGFDIVIGNPPYGVSIKDDYRKAVVKYLGKVPDFEIYYYFIEIANKLISEKGILTYIIPNTYLFNNYAKDYRTSLLKSWAIIEILDCTKFSIFDKATVRNTINIWRKDSDGISVGYKKSSSTSSFIELINRPRLQMKVADLLMMNQNWGLAFSLSQEKISLVNKISSVGNSLSSLYPEISQGLIAYDKYKGQSLEIIESRAYHYTEYKSGLKKWLWGQDVRRYQVSWNSREYIDYCDGIANPRNPKYFHGKRLLIREITNPSIYAAITSEELYHDPAIIIVKDVDSYPLEVVLAILNSKLATFYHFNHSPKASKGAFPKILVQDIKDFPLPILTEEFRYRILANVERLNSLADAFDVENQIDVLVYLLYKLTYDEVRIIDPQIENIISESEYNKRLANG